VELLDRSPSASGSGSCERSASENVAGRGCRPRPGAGRLQDFLTLWKDADPGIPILIAAKTEYAKLK